MKRRRVFPTVLPSILMVIADYYREIRDVKLSEKTFQTIRVEYPGLLPDNGGWHVKKSTSYQMDASKIPDGFIEIINSTRIKPR